MPPIRFPPSFVLLQQEGFLTRSAILTGLNALVSATSNERGLYYAGFFQLSIGIERLLKLDLIVDHMARSDLEPPTGETLRAHGHDLVGLLDAARERASGDAADGAISVTAQEEEMRILGFLSEFARGARYHNLDKLAAGRTAADPLSVWQAILVDLLSRNETPVRRQRRLSRAAALSAMVSPFSFIVGHDLNGEPLTHERAFLAPGEYRSATKYAIWHILTLLKAMRALLDDATERAHAVDHSRGSQEPHVPYMDEFFVFLSIDRSDALRKLRWP